MHAHLLPDGLFTRAAVYKQPHNSSHRREPDPEAPAVDDAFLFSSRFAEIEFCHGSNVDSGRCFT